MVSQEELQTIKETATKEARSLSSWMRLAALQALREAS